MHRLRAFLLGVLLCFAMAAHGWTPFRCGRGVAAAAKEPARAFVLTHQLNALMAATEARVRTLHMPIVLLPARSFGVLTPGLVKLASKIYDESPTEYPFDADEVHLAGGYLDLCLTCTATDVVKDMLGRAGRRRTELTLVVHADITFVKEEGTLWGRFRGLPREEALALAASAAGRHFFPEWDRDWWPVSADPHNHRYTNGRSIVTVLATAGE